MTPDEVQEYINRLTELARQLNTFASSLKTVRTEQKQKSSNTLREVPGEYLTFNPDEISDVLFSEDDLNWLAN